MGVCGTCDARKGIDDTTGVCGTCPSGEGIKNDGKCGTCPEGEGINNVDGKCGGCKSDEEIKNDGTCGAAPAKGLVQGTITIGGTGTFRRRKNWAIFGKDDVKDILKEAFCDDIISGSIVTGSCDLQVLDYNTATGLVKYILSFEILDATELEKSLYIINKDIATNTAITESGLSASPGTIVGASASLQGHLEVVGLNRRPRNNHI